MSSVTIVVLRVARVGHKVKAMHIVNIAVSIIVDIISRDLARVCPDVGGEVRVVVRDASIDYDRDR
jgi:hypothetical protein